MLIQYPLHIPLSKGMTWRVALKEKIAPGVASVDIVDALDEGQTIYWLHAGSGNVMGWGSEPDWVSDHLTKHGIHHCFVGIIVPRKSNWAIEVEIMTAYTWQAQQWTG